LNLRNVKKEGSALRESNEEIKVELQSTKDLLKATAANYSGIQSSYKELENQYNLLSDQNKQLLKATAGEKSELEQEVAKKQDELDKKARLLKEQEADLAKQLSELEDLNGKVSVRESEIAELNDNLNAQKSVLQNLKNNLTTALSGFNANELQVEQKANGKVYVSLSQKLLFQKGSNQIDEKGKKALIKLAKVLAEDNEINIVVEGHTDSDGGSARNWDLSVTRATEVVKILQSAGVSPEKLVASGKALYQPVAANDTPENKGLNRRTEIIISPKLDRLFELINKQN
ncbi:OmpA family protein, partial [Saprospiraceae bacterium]|nr:OmpA family protein [Saprospiraceae bacterium]